MKKNGHAASAYYFLLLKYKLHLRKLHRVLFRAMITYKKFQLSNGLRVIHHYDAKTPIVAMNILYDVGSRDEDPDRTGFAHLFEHLMFGGSVNIPDYDQVLEAAGGENNAFTSNDITNYYLTLPVQNAETAFWLESDRMLDLAFTPKSLDVQRQVVVEEFRQRYLNQPYGDAWLKIRPLAYKVHPYQWSTIGKEIRHIEEASMDEVKDFFRRYYLPNNAILCVAGNLGFDQVKDLCEKWFGPIPAGKVEKRNLPPEPPQLQARRNEIVSKVPQQAIYMAFHMSRRMSPEYYAADLLSDLLSRGESSRFYRELVKSKKAFTEIEAYVTGDLDNGLFIIEGKFADDLSPENAEEMIWQQVHDFTSGSIRKEELMKVKNKVESNVKFAEISALNKSMALCMAEHMGNINLVNEEVETYRSVGEEDILGQAKKILKSSNCSTLVYGIE